MSNKINEKFLTDKLLSQLACDHLIKYLKIFAKRPRCFSYRYLASVTGIHYFINIFNIIFINNQNYIKNQFSFYKKKALKILILYTSELKKSLKVSIKSKVMFYKNIFSNFSIIIIVLISDFNYLLKL